MKTECYHYRSPIGIIEITALESAILKLQFVNEGTRFATQNSLLQLCHNQLDNYFNGINEIFDIPLTFQGSPFQIEVWKELLKIPFGTTMSYGQIAHAIQKPHAARAVGRACKTNPLAIIIPCHRVIASNGSLTGYNAGMSRKSWLLKHERTLLNSINF